MMNAHIVLRRTLAKFAIPSAITIGALIAPPALGNDAATVAQPVEPVLVMTASRQSTASPMLNGQPVPGRVTISQYGEFEDKVTGRFGGFLAVRFDLFFDVPYTISAIQFPSFTYDGAPANFPSVRLCDADPVTGKPILATPLFQATAFAGSADGWNELPVNVDLDGTDRTLYACIEFPAKSTDYPNSFPFLRMDIADLDRGLFGTSFDIPPTGSAGLLQDRNLVVNLVCQVSNPGAVPIEPISNLGVNRVGSRFDYSFRPPSDTRADGVPMPQNSLRAVNLYYRGISSAAFGPWRLWASRGGGSDIVKLDSIPYLFAYWATQAVDRNGHRSILSDVVGVAPPPCKSEVCNDADEPNGQRNEATPIVPPLYLRPETIFPAGDQDFYAFTALPGDTIYAAAVAQGVPAFNRMHLVMYLTDQSGVVAAFSDRSNGSPLDPELTYVVPTDGRFSGKSSRRFTIQVANLYGSLASPDTAPRLTMLWPAYGLTVKVLGSGGADLAAQRASREVPLPALSVAPLKTRPGEVGISYSIPQSSDGARVRIELFDIAGRFVAVLVDQRGNAGNYVAKWDGRIRGGRRAPSGVYFARLRVDQTQLTRKVLVVQ